MEVEEIKRIILDQEELLREKFEKEKIIEREPGYKVDLNGAYLITGPRRSGKSIYAVQLSRGKKYARVDFEDERFYGLRAEELNKVLEAVYEVKGDVELLVFDEVQEIKGWERFVARIRDTVPVIVTGSNARLMSAEMATYLTGRHLDYVLFPFSFREFLKYQGVEVRETTRGVAGLKARLEEYLKVGGFPEGYRHDTRAYLRRLFDDVITKDVMVRCKTRRDIRDLAVFLAENIGREVSSRRLGNAFSLSHQTVINYMDCLEDSYLFILLKRFTGKALEKYSMPRKVYLIDPGIYSSLVTGENVGRKMEDSVLVELLRFREYSGRLYEVYYYKGSNYEVDFVTYGDVKAAVQVSYEVGGLRDRELKGLEKFSEEFRDFNLILVTWDSEGEEALKNGKRVKVVPLWKFLLAPEKVLTR
ncbi:ATP-binding protein [Stygiolobus caldivivus]|uniref:ATPase AAA n=1 Tax=Stygiolobus caldivivus TaxID=2824673 RepID=A0A8D5U3F5_9CREN|nr:ATP-binding protein [Stygiolobus caldivivus]BCU68710.1 ATPase AAA [Stygiolobus caldivivus]